MNKRSFLSRAFAGAMVAASLAALAPAQAQPTSPDELVKQVSNDVLDTVKADKSIKAGDVRKVMQLVDEKVMPHVNFTRMTAAAVGRYWRQASPEQQQKLQAEFKTLLVRTYAGALTQVSDQSIEMRPTRSKPDDTEVVVRSQIVGRGEPVQLDYRLEKQAAGWKIYDVNVLGIWLVENYRNSFAQEISSSGIDGLIAKLVERNKAAAAKG